MILILIEMEESRNSPTCINSQMVAITKDGLPTKNELKISDEIRAALTVIFDKYKSKDTHTIKIDNSYNVRKEMGP